MILIIVVIILAIFLIFMLSNKTKVEHFYNNIPYCHRDNMQSCLTEDCLKQNYNKCLDWCYYNSPYDNKTGCIQRCQAYGKEAYERIGQNSYNFSETLPLFEKYRLY